LVLTGTLEKKKRIATQEQQKWSAILPDQSALIIWKRQKSVKIRLQLHGVKAGLDKITGIGQPTLVVGQDSLAEF
jgi:hypothetical protein